MKKTWGVSCILLLTVEAKTADEAEEIARNILDAECFYADDFNDIEVNLLDW